MTHPLDDIPPNLTNAAEEDKKIFYIAIAAAKGKTRKKMIEAYINRYKEVPHLHDCQPYSDRKAVNW